MKKAKRRTVSFRVKDEIWELLEMKAEEYEMTEHAYACHLCIQGLLGESYYFQEILERQEKSDRDFKTATVALLVDAGKATVTEAKAFVDHMLSKSDRGQSGRAEGSCPKNKADR